jgi:hypothetical protein
LCGTDAFEFVFFAFFFIVIVIIVVKAIVNVTAVVIFFVNIEQFRLQRFDWCSSGAFTVNNNAVFAGN